MVQAGVSAALDADHQDDRFVLPKSGPAVLDRGWHAIDTAADSIDLPTFLWTFDTIGALVLAPLIAAADRGVVIRLLIDDSSLADEDETLPEQNRYPNSGCRIYNPCRWRASNPATRWSLNLGEEFRELSA